METLAAAWLLRRHTPELRGPGRQRDRPDGALPAAKPTRTACAEERFVELFGRDDEVVIAFHGYARALHQLLHGRPHPGRFHVRGFNEQGTTTTPFDMVVLNRMSRYHLALEALRRSRRRARPQAPTRSELTARRCSSATTPTCASTSRTCPRSATGPGTRPDGAGPGAHPHRQRRLLEPEAAACSTPRTSCSPPATAARPPDEARCARSWRRSSPRAPLDAAGHRVVHGGPEFTGPVRVDRRRRGRARPARRPGAAAQPARGRGDARARARCGPACRPSPASTPPSTRRCQPRPRPTRSPAAWRSAGRCAATASTASPTPTRAGAPPSCSADRSPSCGSSPPTSAPAPRWPPSRAAARSTRRWASRRSRDW